MAKLEAILGGTVYNTLSDDIKKKYKDMDLVDSKEYVAKNIHTQVETERDNYKKEVPNRDKQIKTLEPLTKDNEELKTKLQTIQEENKAALEQKEAETQKIIFSNALDNALKSFKAKNPKVLKGLLDIDKLKLDGDNIIGLNDQIEAIKKTDTYLFEKDIAGTGNIDTTTSSTQNANGGAAGTGTENEKNIGVKLAKQKANSDLNTELAKFIRR